MILKNLLLSRNLYFLLENQYGRTHSARSKAPSGLKNFSRIKQVMGIECRFYCGH